MAGFLALMFPGLGHLIIGRPFQALVWFVVIFTGYMLIVPGIILHLMSIVDVARQQRNDSIKAMTQAMRNAK